MCYFLFASLYGKVSENEYQSIQSRYQYRVPLGSKHDVKLAAKTSDDGIVDQTFRVTDWICDCDSPVGKGDPNNAMIVELKDLILALSSLKGAKQINIIKIWTGHKIKKESRLSLSKQ